MVKSGWFPSKLQCSARHVRSGLCALATFVALTALSFGQGTSEFNLQTTLFSPPAINAGGNSKSDITVTSNNGFSGTINLSCQVSPTSDTSPPTCMVSPPAVTIDSSTPATATTTVNTTGDTTAESYNITITGTGPATTFTTPTLSLTVLAVEPQFTITVQTSVAPTSVVAGVSAQGVITVNPINGYISPSGTGKGVVLSCATITPLVTIAPVCSFSYPQGDTSLPVEGVAATSTLTISTFGPVITSAAARPKNFYGLWLLFPMIALAGVGAASGKRARRASFLLSFFILSGGLLLLPSCSSSGEVTTSTPNGITPANTYSFTISGVDGNGVISSNAGTTGTTSPTVTLTVTAPTGH